MSKIIEAEGGEILIKNSLGSYAIIPKKDAAIIEKYMKDGCHDCIDNYVVNLPDYETAAGKAEDGVLLSDDPTNPTPKLEEARKWVSNWFSNRKMQNAETQSLLDASKQNMLDITNNVSITPVSQGMEGTSIKMDTDLTDNRHDILGIYSHKDKAIDILEGAEKGTIAEHEITHATDDGMDIDLRINQNEVIAQNTKDIRKVSDDYIRQKYKNAQETMPIISKYIDDTYKVELEKLKAKYKNLPENERKSKMAEEQPNLLPDIMYKFREENPLMYNKIRPLIKGDWTDFMYANNQNKISYEDSADLKSRYKTIFMSEYDYIDKIKNNVKPFNKYIKNFDEVHARIMEIRRDLDIKPDQVINETFIEENKDKLKKNDAYLELREISKEGDKSIINLLNQLVQVDKEDSKIKNA